MRKFATTASVIAIAIAMQGLHPAVAFFGGKLTPAQSGGNLTKVAIIGEVDTTLARDWRNPPTWEMCYRLGWIRGVHVELGELPGWMQQCLSGKIPPPRRSGGR
jgi:hypothetical protein